MTNQLISSRFTINAKSLNNYWHASGWNSRVFCPLVCWLIDNLGQFIVCFDSRHHKIPFTFGWFAFSARTHELIFQIPDRQAKNPPCIPWPNFGESRFLGSSQIPFRVNIFCVFPNPAPYFGQILDPENTIQDLGSTLALNSSIFLSRFIFVFPGSFFLLSMAFQACAFLRAFDVITSILKICYSFYSPSISSGEMKCEFLIECHEVGLFRLINFSWGLPKTGQKGLLLPFMSHGRCRNLW